MDTRAPLPFRSKVLTLLVVSVTLTVLDLVFLGVVARPLYDRLLGPLRAPEVHWPAAALFYVMYVVATAVHGAWRAASVRDAAFRGAEMGFLAYATYELTNWAVLAGWPAGLVPVDMAWGVVLTGATAAAGRLVLERTAPRA